VTNWGLKEIGRTLEAWMAVFHLEQGMPFYRFQASAGDTAEVCEIQAGHFYLAFDGSGRRLVPFVDPVVVFGQNTALSAPDGFVAQPLAELARRRQITTGRTPCGFFGTSALLEPGEATQVTAIVGHTGNVEQIHRETPRLAQPAYVRHKRQEANELVEQLTSVVATHTSSPQFDAYTRQTLLDNVLRVVGRCCLAARLRPCITSTRASTATWSATTTISPSPPSPTRRQRQLPRREPEPALRRAAPTWGGAFNVLSFLGLIQADGYNPLVVEGSRFSLPPERRAEVLALIERAEGLEPELAQPFTPGRLLRAIADNDLRPKVSPETLVAAALRHAEQQFQASFGEGYWIDHWTYTLDLIETYLAVYPDRKEELLFGPATVPFFDSPAVVRPAPSRLCWPATAGCASTERW